MTLLRFYSSPASACDIQPCFDGRDVLLCFEKQMSTPAAQTSLLEMLALRKTLVCARRAVCGEGPKAGGAGAEGAAEVLAGDQQPKGGALPGRAGGDPGDDAGALALLISVVVWLGMCQFLPAGRVLLGGGVGAGLRHSYFLRRDSDAMHVRVFIPGAEWQQVCSCPAPDGGQGGACALLQAGAESGTAAAARRRRSSRRCWCRCSSRLRAA